MLGNFKFPQAHTWPLYIPEYTSRLQDPDHATLCHQSGIPGPNRPPAMITSHPMSCCKPGPQQSVQAFPRGWKRWGSQARRQVGVKAEQVHTKTPPTRKQQIPEFLFASNYKKEVLTMSHPAFIFLSLKFTQKHALGAKQEGWVLTDLSLGLQSESFLPLSSSRPNDVWPHSARLSFSWNRKEERSAFTMTFEENFCGILLRRVQASQPQGISGHLLPDLSTEAVGGLCAALHPTLWWLPWHQAKW